MNKRNCCRYSKVSLFSIATEKVLYKRVRIYTRPVRCEDHCPHLNLGNAHCLLSTEHCTWLQSFLRGWKRRLLAMDSITALVRTERVNALETWAPLCLILQIWATIEQVPLSANWSEHRFRRIRKSLKTRLIHLALIRTKSWLGPCPSQTPDDGFHGILTKVRLVWDWSKRPRVKFKKIYELHIQEKCNLS